LRRKAFFLTLVCCLLSFMQPIVATPYLNGSEPEKIKKFVGQMVAVEGVVMDSHIARSGKVRFLNFGPEYKTAFAVVIFTGDLKNFKSIGEPTEYYLGKRVVVSGRIKIYKGRPEIIVENPRQIKTK